MNSLFHKSHLNFAQAPGSYKPLAPASALSCTPSPDAHHQPSTINHLAPYIQASEGEPPPQRVWYGMVQVGAEPGLTRSHSASHCCTPG